MQNKVQKLQNRAARVLTYSMTYSYDADAGHLFELLGWRNLSCKQQIQKATMVYKSLHGLASEYLCSNVESHETAYNLRDSENKLTVPLPHTNYHKQLQLQWRCVLEQSSARSKASGRVPGTVQTPNQANASSK